MDIGSVTNCNAGDYGAPAATGTSRQGAGSAAGKSDRAAVKVAKEFESLFVGMMLKSMRDTVGKDKLTSGGRGEEVYGSLLDQEYAKALTEHGGIGLSAMLEQQIVHPGITGTVYQGKNNYDKTTDKAEVNYENR